MLITTVSIVSGCVAPRQYAQPTYVATQQFAPTNGNAQCLDGGNLVTINNKLLCEHKGNQSQNSDNKQYVCNDGELVYVDGRARCKHTRK